MMPVSIYSTPGYRVDWPGHVFPTEKYWQVRERLLSERPETSGLLREPEPATIEQLQLVHPAKYLNRVRELAKTPELAYLEFEIPVDEAVFDAIVLQAGGSIGAARDAVASTGASVSLGGGFHHAFADHGEGFCFINDVAVALRTLQQEGSIERAAVIDCDLHQGNGTARIFIDDPSVFTFSIHQENNYPVKQRSDLDIGLEDGAGDERYLSELVEHLPRILDAHRPDLVLYVAGADPFVDDQLGALELTKDGLHNRDMLVFESCRSRQIPIAAVLAGGYARRSEDVTDIHVRMVCDLMDAYTI